MTLLGDSLRGGLLEIGCGRSTFLSELEQQYSSLACVGCDIDVEALRANKQAHPDVLLVAAGADALPFRDGAFGTVLMLDVLEHVPDDQAAICEASRLLDMGGQVVITTPNRGLFSWLDVSNLKLYFPRLFERFSLLTGASSHSVRQYLDGAMASRPPEARLSTILNKHSKGLEHRHYSLSQLRVLLAGFDIQGVRRTGLLIFPMMHLIGAFVSKVFKTHMSLVMRLAALEDRMEFGPISYNVAVRAIKAKRQH